MIVMARLLEKAVVVVVAVMVPLPLKVIPPDAPKPLTAATLTVPPLIIVPPV